MSSFMGDASGYLDGLKNPGAVSSTAASARKNSDRMNLDMSDFLMLMVAELTNQSIDETADTSEMLNQMVMMQMVDALVNMTDASLMSYSASLVGKEVTIGQYDSDGKLTEIVGTVAGTGSYGGEQVVFLEGDNNFYYLKDIMAVGRLPQAPETPDDTTGTPGDTEKPGETETPGGTEGTETPENPDQVEGTDPAPEPGETETDPEYSGESGAPEETGT